MSHDFAGQEAIQAARVQSWQQEVGTRGRSRQTSAVAKSTAVRAAMPCHEGWRTRSLGPADAVTCAGGSSH